MSLRSFATAPYFPQSRLFQTSNHRTASLEVMLSQIRCVQCSLCVEDARVFFHRLRRVCCLRVTDCRRCHHRLPQRLYTIIHSRHRRSTAAVRLRLRNGVSKCHKYITGNRQPLLARSTQLQSAVSPSAHTTNTALYSHNSSQLLQQQQQYSPRQLNR